MIDENKLSAPKEMLKVYCDGSTIKNPGKSGYAFVVLKDDKIIGQGGNSILLSTSIRMEVMALLHSMQWILNSSEIDNIDFVEFYSDSEYTVKSTLKCGQWLSHPTTDKANMDLWRMFIKLQEEFHKRKILLLFNWVKAHSKIKWNEHVDKMAYAQSSKTVGIEDVIYLEMKKIEQEPYSTKSYLAKNKLVKDLSYIKQILNEEQTIGA